MILFNSRDFAKIIEEGKRLMGLDMGSKKIGLAISDRSTLFANPHSVYKRRNMKKDLVYMYEFYKEQDCCGIVIGMPFGIDGEKTDWCQAIERFAKKLSNNYGFKILIVDECFTTKEAESILECSNLSYDRRQSLDDKVSASIILDTFLKVKNTVEK